MDSRATLSLFQDFVPVAYTNSLMAAMMKLTYSTEERLVNSLMEKNASKITMSRMVKYVLNSLWEYITHCNV